MSKTTAPSSTPSKTQTKIQDCSVCKHVDEHGWYGPSIKPARSHCRRCHRSWASLVEGHCTMCCEHFANVKAFDAHLLEEGCRPPAEVIRKDGRPRLTQRKGPFGITWRLAFYGTRPDFDAAGADAEDADSADDE